MTDSFTKFPHKVVGDLDPFNVRIPDEELNNLKEQLRLSTVAPKTFWNQQKDGKFGVSRDWIEQTKQTWLNSFDWRKQEDRINKLPNYKLTIKDEEHGPYKVHFVGLFSAKQDAIPVIMMHGWPGSFLEFLPILEILISKYTPETLPYHVIVPSLPGYGFSESGDQSSEFTMASATRAMNQLMVQLGFGEAYVAHGGDVGSGLSSALAVTASGCKAYHVNLLGVPEDGKERKMDLLSPSELEQVARSAEWRKTGAAYTQQNGTRPATVGLVLASSPLALLSWIGEKLIDWAGVPLPIETILANTTLWWFTSTAATSFYPYRSIVTGGWSTPVTDKPLGYSSFSQEIMAVPKAWAEQSFPTLTQFTRHEKGGHFAAWEVPEVLLEDVESFVAKIGHLF